MPRLKLTPWSRLTANPLKRLKTRWLEPGRTMKIRDERVRSLGQMFLYILVHQVHFQLTGSKFSALLEDNLTHFGQKWCIKWSAPSTAGVWSLVVTNILTNGIRPLSTGRVHLNEK